MARANLVSVPNAHIVNHHPALIHFKAHHLDRIYIGGALDCTQVRAGVERAPGLRLLVTSREGLNLQVERVLETQGLAAPAANQAEPARGQLSSRRSEHLRDLQHGVQLPLPPESSGRASPDDLVDGCFGSHDWIDFLHSRQSQAPRSSPMLLVNWTVLGLDT